MQEDTSTGLVTVSNDLGKELTGEGRKVYNTRRPILFVQAMDSEPTVIYVQNMSTKMAEKCLNQCHIKFNVNAQWPVCFMYTNIAYLFFNTM